MRKINAIIAVIVLTAALVPAAAAQGRFPSILEAKLQAELKPSRAASTASWAWPSRT